MTTRKDEVLDRHARGESVAEIARALHVTQRWVKAVLQSAVEVEEL